MIAAWLFGPAPVHCTVELEGVPVSVISSHKFVTDHRSVVAAHRVSFRLRGEQVLRLVGPRYTGAWRLSAEVCRVGVVKVKARPRNARVHFRGPPRNVSVRCTGCGGNVDSRWHLVETFPAFKTVQWRREVEFELKAAGFHPLKVRTVIHPGANEVDVRLHPRD